MSLLRLLRPRQLRQRLARLVVERAVRGLDGRLRIRLPRGGQPAAQEVGQDGLEREEAGDGVCSEQPPIRRGLQDRLPALHGQARERGLGQQVLAVDLQRIGIDSAGERRQRQQQPLVRVREVAEGVVDARQQALGLVRAAGVQAGQPVAQRGQHLGRGLPRQVRQHHLDGQGVTGQQLEQLTEVGVLAVAGRVVPPEHRVRQAGRSLRVQPGQVICARGQFFQQPRLRPARPQQDDRSAARKAAQERAEPLLPGLGQRVLDGEVRAGDRLEVVEDEQVACAAQTFGQIRLLGLLRHGQERAAELARREQPFSDGVEDLLAVPRAAVPPEVEDLVHEAGALPPRGDVAQERALARAAHAADEQQVARQDAALDVEDVEVAAEEAVLRLLRVVARGLALEVCVALFGGHRARREAGARVVAVDDRQQPVLQRDRLVEMGAAPLVIAQRLPRPAHRIGRVAAARVRRIEQRAIERGHEPLRRADRDRVAHRDDELHARLHQLRGDARLAAADLHGRLACVEDGDGDAVRLQQPRQLPGLDRVGPLDRQAVVVRVLEEQEAALPVVRRDLVPAIAHGLERERAGAGLPHVRLETVELVEGQEAAVDVEVDDVVVARAVSLPRAFQVIDEAAVGGRAQDVHPHAQPRPLQRVQQGPRDGAVGDIARAVGPRGDDEHVDRRRGLAGRGHGLERRVAADEDRIEAQRTAEIRILERLPVQRMEGRLARHLDDEAFQARVARAHVSGIGAPVAKHLREQRLAVGVDALRGVLRLDRVGERERQPFLEVPRQPLFLPRAERVGDGHGHALAVVEADARAEGAGGLLAGLLDGDGGHGGLRDERRSCTDDCAVYTIDGRVAPMEHPERRPPLRLRAHCVLRPGRFQKCLSENLLRFTSPPIPLS
ncbi:MAG: hypothetical protein BWY52_03072 [Chloroflexi bacterium ADurb.Bin325]|nr:MAG: hypothetical protein BWY52_03072 [Chloroflexi bacterium ADurb.Bin325]